MAGNTARGTRYSPTTSFTKTTITSPTTTIPPSSIFVQVQQAQTMRLASSSSPSTPPRTSPPPPSKSTSKQTPLKSLPLKSLNQSITSRLTTPAGARPLMRKGDKPLPGNYQSVARRVTMTIVALPILLVTSWVLWDRLVLGQEQKSLIREPPVVPGPPMAAEMEARNNRG
ncbi:5a755dae-42dd-4376-9e6d-b95d36e24091 [Sclerotinia trifoliorum]|uniref:5a755dae-42dd-4376-9e6d-b95d36e24091 n=1 Tax=Sclerotinia trifoliorum TaxID=28548 RepID=A0A8H2VW32_9HELO|nr:5a755dae-42dd-4376-9e6d-b95d36e24091 [Sclerotinia trifoliorum]